MALIADGILILAAASAAIYCLVLSRRLSRLSRLDRGLGQAITQLSTRVDEMSAAMAEARTATEQSAEALRAEIARAEAATETLSRLCDEVPAGARTRAKASEAAKAAKAKARVGAKAEPKAAAKPDAPTRRSSRANSPKSAPARPRGEIDGVINTYLKSKGDAEEAALARRLVMALAKPGAPLKDQLS